jgi:hypothetical protein
MPGPLTREQLIALTRKLMRGEGTEDEIAKWSELIARSVPCPTGEFFAYIFYSDRYGLGDNPTPEAVVDKALSYAPLQFL